MDGATPVAEVPTGLRGVDPTGEATLELFRENPAYTEFLWRSLSALGGGPIAGRVLEVGCGLGNLTGLLLREPGLVHVRAIDMDPAYVEHVRRGLADPRLSVATARAEEFCPEDLRGPERGFDWIVSSNVLEHIRDDAGTLANFRRMLRPDGRILLLVPAHPFLYSGLDESLSHFRRYRPRDLRRIAAEASLEVVRWRHFNPVGALGWLLNGKVLRRRVLPARQLAIYSRFGLALSAWVDRWNPLPFGVSLLAVLRAPAGSLPS